VPIYLNAMHWHSVGEGEFVVQETFAIDVMNSLTAHIAVLDSQGLIVEVNEAWKRLALENGAGDDTYYVGTHYLAVCEGAVGHGDDATVEEVSRGLHALLRGKEDSFSLEYPCHFPNEDRWFAVRMTRFSRGDNSYVVVAHENITARKLAEETLRTAEHTLRQVLETLPVGVWIMDRTGTIVHGNAAGKRLWAGARHVWPDQLGVYQGHKGLPIPAEEWAAVRAVHAGKMSMDEEIRIEFLDGTGKTILSSTLPLYDTGHRITGVVIVNQDISSRKKDEELLRRAKEAVVEAVNRELELALAREQTMARTDALTGVNNRRHFFDVASREFTVAQRYRSPLSVLLIDIDHFKVVNDTLGHQVGDEVLKCVAQLTAGHLREADVFARYGGEEFIALLPNTSAQGASVVAENIRTGIASRGIGTDQGHAGVTISIGVADMLPDGDSLDRLVRRADMALYAAKEAGRNRSMVFAPNP
jgi:diguanylate cyclase (GGDEF)-like protein